MQQSPWNRYADSRLDNATTSRLLSYRHDLWLHQAKPESVGSFCSSSQLSNNNNNFNNQVNPNLNQDESIEGEGVTVSEVVNKPADPMTMGRDREAATI